MVWIYNLITSIVAGILIALSLLVANATGVTGFELNINAGALMGGMIAVMFFFTTFLSAVCMVVHFCYEIGK